MARLLALLMAMNRTTTVLLLGTNERAGLTLSRSLGRRGIRVEVARLSPSPAERSRHVSAVHHLGDPLLDVDSYVSRLEELLRATPFDLLIPIDERADADIDLLCNSGEAPTFGAELEEL